MSFLKNWSKRVFGRARANNDLEEPDSVSSVPGRPLVGVGKNDLPKMGDGTLLLRSAAGARTPLDTLLMICDLNPDASLAVWNFLRLVNPEHELNVYQMPERTEIDEEGQSLLVDRADGLLGSYGKDYGGGLSQLINVLTLTLVTQGAVAGEIELDDRLSDVLDWCPVSPKRITLLKDTERNEHIVPVIQHQGNDYLLPTDQFRYIPLDPTISNPYGRSPMWPALESVFFQVEVLRDLKMVAHITGHPRMHVSLLEEVVELHVPARYNAPGQEDEKRAWMDAYLTDVANQYKNLEPDDALFTWDWVGVDGLSAGHPSYDISSLVKIVETQVISALKQLPILLGRVEGSGLAHGTVQWQIFAQTIQALRKPVALMASWWGTQTLRVRGRNSVCIVTFPLIRTQDRVREAQAELLELQATMAYLSQGWIDQDEASEKHVGHAPVSEPVASFTGFDQEEGEEEGFEEAGEEGEGTEEEGTAGEGTELGRLLERQLAGGVYALAGGNGRGGRGQRVDALGPIGVSDDLSESAYFSYLPTWLRQSMDRRREWLLKKNDVRRAMLFDNVNEISLEGS